MRNPYHIEGPALISRGSGAMLKIMVPLANEHEGSPRWVYRQQCARRIDALVRRAVREVWKARGEFDDLLCNDCTGWSRIADRIERKYGVRL